MHTDLVARGGRQRHLRLAAGEARAERRLPGARGRRRDAGARPWSPGCERAGGRLEVRRAGRPGRRARRPRPRGPAARRPHRRRTPGGAGRRLGARALPRPARARTCCPPRLRADLENFAWDDSTVKVDWALSGPVPWKNEGVAGRGHRAPGRRPRRDLAVRARARRRAGAGRAVPAVRPDDDLRPDPVTRRHRVGVGVHARAERPPRRRRRRADRRLGRPRDPGGAPGPGRGAGRAVRPRLPRPRRRPARRLPAATCRPATPTWCTARSTAARAALHQQLFFRPTPGLGRPETHVAGLYLASAGAHPGGGVHGACGANAARAALRARTTGRLAARGHPRAGALTSSARLSARDADIPGGGGVAERTSRRGWPLVCSGSRHTGQRRCG